MTQAPRRNSHLVDIDRTPAHHKLQPGDWWQFIFDEPRYHEASFKGEGFQSPWQVGDEIQHQFSDEPWCWRYFKITAIPLEGVYECSYISRHDP